jgi:hypothetical protein
MQTSGDERAGHYLHALIGWMLDSGLWPLFQMVNAHALVVP